MAAATTTTLGEIVLGGDLTGEANAPELVATGVIPGTYSPLQRVRIDAKGRAIAAGALAAAELGALFTDATTSVQGVYSWNGGITTVGTEAQLDESSLPATGSTFGFVAAGSGFTNTAGVLSIEDASTSVKGIASYNSSDFSTSSGAVSLASYSTFTSNLGVATGSLFGTAKAGTNFNVSSGTLSVSDASTSTKGVASFNSSDFTVSSGAVSLLNVANYANQLTWSTAQAGTSNAQTLGGTTFTPNFQTDAVLQDITLSGNLTINFPSTLAPAGTFVRMIINLRYNAGTPYTVTLSGSYLTNRPMAFTNAASSASDVLTLICSSTVCYAILNETFQ